MTTRSSSWTWSEAAGGVKAEGVMEPLHHRQVDALLGAELLVGAGQLGLGGHDGNVHEGERQLPLGDEVADRLHRQAGGVPGPEEPQPGGVLDSEPSGWLLVLQRSGLHGPLDEGWLDLGQPSQVTSRQLDPIHCDRPSQRCCSRTRTPESVFVDCRPEPGGRNRWPVHRRSRPTPHRLAHRRPRAGRTWVHPDRPRPARGRPHLPPGWSPDRLPLLLEASLPGVFAAGDVRHGSSKRVASAVGERAIAVQRIHDYLGEH
jgi:hypothetical protein